MEQKNLDKLEKIDAFNLFVNEKRTVKELAVISELSVDSVRRFLKIKDKHIFNKRNIPNVNIEECIILYNSGKTCEQIAKLFGSSRQTISKILKANNIDVKRKDLISIDESIFDNIDSEEKAYWLGFLFADGNIGSRVKTLEVNISERDSIHLEKLRMFLKYDRNLIHETNGKYCNCRLSVTNHHMWDVLNSYGCTPHKSLTLQFPDVSIFSSIELIRHFIRGYVDGDGCLTWRNKAHTRAEVNVLGTEYFLNEMQKYLPMKVRTIRTKHKDYDHRCKVYQSEDTTAFKVAFYLYENSNIYLDRKFEIYKTYCRLYEKLYRELQTNIGEPCDGNTEIS